MSGGSGIQYTVHPHCPKTNLNPQQEDQAVTYMSGGSGIQYTVHPHCPKSNLNHLIRTEQVMVSTDATVYVWLHKIQVNKSWTYTIASTPALTDSVFYAKIQIIFDSGSWIRP